MVQTHFEILLGAKVIEQKVQASLSTHIGSRLKLRRLLLGRTVDDVSKCLGVGIEDYIEYEDGTLKPSAKQIVDICTILDISPSWLFL